MLIQMAESFLKFVERVEPHWFKKWRLNRISAANEREFQKALASHRNRISNTTKRNK